MSTVTSPAAAAAPAPFADVPSRATLDRLEIQELVARYNHAIDRGDTEGWVGCFSEDGAFDGVAGRLEGTAALRDFAEALTTAPEWAEFRPMRHWTTNFLIDLDGDAATMRADHVLYRQTADGAVPLLMAVYHDTLRREDGRWLFAERVVELQGGTRA